MATLKIGDKRVTVGDEFMSLPPDQQQATVDEIARSLNVQAAPQTSAGGKSDRERSWTETGMDVLKSAGTGLVQGAVGLATMPQDLGTMLGEKATGLIDQVMGVSPEQTAASRQAVAQSRTAISPPSGPEVMQSVQNVTGPLHQPQTTAGQYAKTIGEFAPSAAAGPGGLMRKAALAVVPGAASEAAGQATEGTAAEPYARIGGALAGGLTAALPGSKAGTRELLKTAPTHDAVKTMTRDAYKALDDAKVVFDQGAYKSMAMKMQTQLRKEGLLPEQGGEVAGLLKQVMDRTKKLNGWTEVDSIRKNLGSIAATKDPAMAMEARRAKIMLQHLDDLVTFGKVSSMAGVKRGDIAPMVGKARELARREIIGRNINRMKDKAEWYASGPESGLRNQFASYAKKNDTNLTTAEEKAFQKVVKREGMLNPVHNLGSRLGQIGVGGAAWGSTGSLTIGIASAIGSSLARKFMEAYTKKGVNDAIKTVLAGKSAQEKARVLDMVGKYEAAQQALLATDAGRRSAQGLPQGGQPAGAFPFGVGTSR